MKRAVYSGEKAVEVAADFNPDALVSDVIMHDLNGIDAAIQISKVLPTMRILLFSGWSGVGYLMEQAYNRGYDLEIFGIPIHPQDLMNKLREPVNPENLWSNARLQVPPSFLEPPEYRYTLPRSRLRRISDKIFALECAWQLFEAFSLTNIPPVDPFQIWGFACYTTGHSPWISFKLDDPISEAHCNCMEKEIFSICVARSNSVSSGLFQIHHRARGERMTNRSSFEAGLRILFLLTMLASASSALAQAPPVLNTPYRCANGITYTVTVCKPYRADQWCQWTEQQNGQVVTTVNSSWSSMTGRLQGCTIASASTASTTNSANATSSKASVEAQQSSAQLAARVKAASQQANQANQGNPTQPYGTSPTGAQPLPPTNDPAQIAIRRCFELGGAGLQCVGAGMSVGMKQFLMGIDLNALKGPGQKGLVILGTWTAPSGLNFWFDHGSVGITNCGLMVHGDHGYAVSASGGKYVINIANQPQPLVIMLGPDGRASGPAAQDITGDQVAGYTVTTNVRTGVVVSKVPIYKPITVHCNIGSLKAGAQFAVDPGLPSNDPSPGVLSAIGTVLSTMAGDSGPPQLMLSPGPRMAGIFTGANGFRIQFDDGSAIVDCAQAHILSQYDVSMQSGSAVVSLKNGGNPFNLAIQGDGTLTGSGTAAVDGKIMTALSGADPVFAPTSASCPLNRLSAAK